MNTVSGSTGRLRCLAIVALAFVASVVVCLAAESQAKAAAPDIGITKSAITDAVDIREDAGFRIEAVNRSDSPADISIVDPLPGGPDLYWWLDDGWDNCDIEWEGDNQTLVCDFADVPPGESVTATVETWFDYGTCSTLENVATATGRFPQSEDSTTVRDSASVTCQLPDMTLTKTAGKQTVVAGEDITFTIRLSNAGPGLARNLVLSDPLPEGTAGPWEIVDGPSDEWGGEICWIYDWDDEEQFLDCMLPELQRGESISVTVKAPTSVEFCGVYNNTATVTERAPARTADGPERSTSARRAVAVPPEGIDLSADASVSCRQPLPANLTLKKAAGKSRIKAGDAVSFTMTTTNTGDGTAAGVRLSDSLPEGVAGQWTITNQPAGGPCAISSGTLACAFGDLAGGASRKVTVRAATSRARCATWTNIATVTAENAPAATADATVQCALPKPKPNLQLKVKANRRVARPGQRVRYTVSVRNRRKDSTAKNLRVCDRIANHMVVVNRGGGRIRGGRICWQVPNLPGTGRWVRFHYSTRVDLNAKAGARARDLASVENLRARWVVKIKRQRRPKTPGRTPVTG